MLQITKANDVVPMSLYLSGIFFHGSDFQSKLTSPDPLWRLVSPSELNCSNSLTRSPVSTPGTLSLLGADSFSLMLQQIRKFKRRLEGGEYKRWSLNTEALKTGPREIVLLWGKERKFSAKGVNLAIFFTKARNGKGMRELRNFYQLVLGRERRTGTGTGKSYYFVCEERSTPRKRLFVAWIWLKFGFFRCFAPWFTIAGPTTRLQQRLFYFPYAVFSLFFFSIQNVMLKFNKFYWHEMENNCKKIDSCFLASWLRRPIVCSVGTPFTFLFYPHNSPSNKTSKNIFEIENTLHNIFIVHDSDKSIATYNHLGRVWK